MAVLVVEMVGVAMLAMATAAEMGRVATDNG
jgi:hypothetical protein